MRQRPQSGRGRRPHGRGEGGPEEPVMLGAAMLGGVAGGAFEDVQSAMARMSQIGRTYEPAGGAIAVLHDARFRAFKRLQALACEIR